MQRRSIGLGFAAIVVASCLDGSIAAADGIAYPHGSFARSSSEKTVIVWDAAQKTEHLIRALTLKGDPETFGLVMATPTVPTLATESDDVVDRVANIFVPPPAGDAGVAPMDVLKRTQVGAFEAVTLNRDDHALGDWLAHNHFIDKPTLRTWGKAYLDKGWVLTAVRCTAKGTGDRSLEVATIRLSFKLPTGVAFVPYAEAAVDAADEAAYGTKYNDQPRYRGYSYGTKPLDLYVIAPWQLQTVSGQTTAGPPVADSMRVTQSTLASALGETKGWGFDPKSQPTWLVTHLSENVWQRATHDDLGLAPYDLPKARPGLGITEADDRPTGPTFPASSMAWMNPSDEHANPASPHKKLFRIGAIALFFLVAGAAAYAVMTEQQQQRRQDPRS